MKLGFGSRRTIHVSPRLPYPGRRSCPCGRIARALTRGGTDSGKHPSHRESCCDA
jgi:hypothetical protein